MIPGERDDQTPESPELQDLGELERAVAARRDDHVARMPEKSEAEARLRAVRRLRISLVTAGLSFAVFLVVFVVVKLKDRPVNACAAMLGPVHELEQLVGQPLRLEEGIAGERDCDLRVVPAAGGAPLVVLENRHANHHDRIRADLEAKFPTREPLTLATGAGLLFVGATQRTVVFRHADIATELTLDSRAFDTTRAKSFAAAVAARAPR